MSEGGCPDSGVGFHRQLVGVLEGGALEAVLYPDELRYHQVDPIEYQKILGYLGLAL
jgi:hypothetical protein